MGAVVAGVGNIEDKSLDAWDVLCCCGLGSYSLRVRDVGYVPMHWKYSGHISPFDVLHTNGTAAE